MHERDFTDPFRRELPPRYVVRLTRWANRYRYGVRIWIAHSQPGHRISARMLETIHAIANEVATAFNVQKYSVRPAALGYCVVVNFVLGNNRGRQNG